MGEPSEGGSPPAWIVNRIITFRIKNQECPHALAVGTTMARTMNAFQRWYHGLGRSSEWIVLMVVIVLVLLVALVVLRSVLQSMGSCRCGDALEPINRMVADGLPRSPPEEHRGHYSLRSSQGIGSITTLRTNEPLVQG